MQRLLPLGACLICVMLAGCGGATQQAILPTATPAPIQPTATSTPTELPPPTVTPFPTVTPRGEASVPTVDAAAATTDPQATAATEATQGADPTVAQGGAGINKGQMLFQATFDQGWPTLDEAAVKISIISGKYDFKIGPRDSGFISTTAVDSADLYAEVDATVTACPENSGYGLRFREQSNGDYYALIITCSGRFSLLVRANGALAKEPLYGGVLPAGINGSAGSHTVGVLTLGTNFSFYLDGQLIGQTSDTRFGTGDVALYAFTDSATVIQVAFDNLEVWAAQ